MAEALYRVKAYSHPRYKFVVRAKIKGKWQRRYFATEPEAIAFAERQNAQHEAIPGEPPTRPSGKRSTTRNMGPVLQWVGPESAAPAKDLSKIISPAYFGPRIQRYIGDSWAMHLPFAYDLMREFAPKIFVELGVKQGESYFAFCQSAAENKINVKCYGVDSWRGDVQTGGLDPKIRDEAISYNWRYSSFSELKPMLFAEALADFEDGSIDLLHIDGTHTYSEVKADFESWLPKVSPNGIVLFHDVIVRDQGFGVWKVWEEIAGQDKSFLFEFGFGLGAWKKEPLQPSDPPFIRALFSAHEAESRRINESYANAAAALALWHSLARQFPPPQQGPAFPGATEDESAEIARFQHDADRQLEQLAERQREIDEKIAHVDLLQRENRERTEQVEHFKNDAEKKAKQAAQLQRAYEEKSEEVLHFQREARENQREAREKASDLAQLREENADLRRDRDRHAQSITLIKSQLAATEERLEQASRDVLEAEWESLSLRRGLSHQSDSSASARIVELESRTAAAESERDHLRAMLSRLQQDIDLERSRAEQVETVAAH